MRSSPLQACDERISRASYNEESNRMAEKIRKTDAEWRAQLNEEQYHITRQRGTERPFTGKYNNSKMPGTYTCVCCGQELFSSDTKYESGSGWPSFYQPIAPESVATRTDSEYGMTRTEVLCSRCDAHLGHVFPDGPRPTGLRYCMNSASLDLKPKT
jgi:peptide-methionine (R)-S-oxide reductase